MACCKVARYLCTYCLKFAKANDLPLQRFQISNHRNPPWLLKEASFINNLALKRKANTSREEYKSIFSEIAANYRAMGWKLIYTDGSKTEQTSYAVVKEQNEIITYGLLFPFCSIFTAEAVAIFNAFLYAIQNKGKFIVCTDSLSCFSAIQNYNNSNYIIDFIRETLTTKPQKIKIMWIPGHADINGNTHADQIAKQMRITPTITTNIIFKHDIYSLIKHQRQSDLLREWSNYNHPYSLVNPKRVKPGFSESIPTNMVTPYIRLRLGHTILTHAHILQGIPPNLCPFCNSTLSINHILSSCPNLASTKHHYFRNIDPLEILKNPTEANISILYNYLKDTDLLRRI